MSKWKRDLRRMLDVEAPTATIEETGSGHLRVTLENGRYVITSATPSDTKRAGLNVRADVRREMRR